MKKLAILGGILALAACAEDGSMHTSHLTASMAPAHLMLTPDEEIIWAGLTEAERQRAILFVTNGASLVSSLGSQ